MSDSITTKIIEEFENLPRASRIYEIDMFEASQSGPVDYISTVLQDFIEWAQDQFEDRFDMKKTTCRAIDEWLLERAQKMLNSKIAAAKLGVP